VSDEIDVERLANNLNKFKGLCAKLGDRSENVLKLVEDFEERLCLAPALTSGKFEQAAPGGLVEHSLRTFIQFKKLLDLYQISCATESMILIALFHDIGKLGTLEHELFIPETDGWRREHYGAYKINADVPYMSMPLRSIWLLQQYGITLSLDEFQCILLVDGMYSEANKYYAGHESRLTLLFQQAELNAMRMGKLDRAK
jgi:hypothetical protein